MADVIDFSTRKNYRGAPESKVVSEFPDDDPATMPTADDLRMARALLIAQAERENARWARETNAKNRRARIRRGRLSFSYLALMFALLGWFWACGVCAIMILMMNRLVKE